MTNEQLLEKLQELEKEFIKAKEENEIMLDVEQASLFLNLSTSTIYKLTSLKKLPHHKPGGKKIYFRREDLIKYQFKNRIQDKDELVGQAHQIKI